MIMYEDVFSMITNTFVYFVKEIWHQTKMGNVLMNQKVEFYTK